VELQAPVAAQEIEAVAEIIQLRLVIRRSVVEVVVTGVAVMGVVVVVVVEVHQT
jgi:hypothetical protein